jgi:hypothetical protein
MTKRTIRPATPQAMWNEILAALERRTDAIAAELAGAEDQFPELAAAFNLLLAYTNYSNRVRSLPTGLGEIGGPTPIPTPVDLVRLKPLIVRCSQGDADACEELAKRTKILDEHDRLGPKKALPKPVTCEQLFKQYRDALQQELDGTPETLSDMPEMPFSAPKSVRLRTQLLEQGCIKLRVHSTIPR